MVDDLAKLPGDDDLEPKRRGLRRLRKAERAFLKRQQQQQQQEQKSSAAAGQPAGGRRKSAAAASAAAAGSATDETSLPQSTDARGKGRQWERRHWRTNGASDLTLVVLAAGTIAAATAGDSTAPSFGTVLEGLAADAAKAEQAATEEETSAAETPATKGGGGGGGNKGGKGGKKAKGAGKGKEPAGGGAAAEGEEESDEVAAARKQKEEREADVKAWAEGLREALEGETFVTTAHRAAVAERDAILVGLAERAKVGARKVRRQAFFSRPFRFAGRPVIDWLACDPLCITRNRLCPFPPPPKRKRGACFSSW